MNNYEFTFYPFNNLVQLKLWDLYGITFNQFYPQTFTVEECVEDWCADRGGFCESFHYDSYKH